MDYRTIQLLAIDGFQKGNHPMKKEKEKRTKTTNTLE
jgi:hypothetical protein